VINRKEEVRSLLSLTPEEVINKAKEHLIVCENLDELHVHFAKNIASEIQESNEKNLPTRLILPVGPVGQYPILTNMINTTKLDLNDIWFFFMDEYCDESGRALQKEHPLSFKGIIQKQFLNLLDEEHRSFFQNIFFPDEKNIKKLSKLIERIGGIDTCYGGIGIHGHLAFNEPEKNVINKSFRKVHLNNFTITMNAIRAQVGGNLENFPKEAFTIGMKEILRARKIRLYCRNGTTLDWANTILRIALFGQPGDDYPVSYIRDHPDFLIITDKDTLASPQVLL